ncbi:MAG: CaiB/BaiF CoA-transferase family protein [Anaerolineales bacterium]|nr:CaiB/BaiF CoA-transferase family protein [Anaerolineales bacterium]
MSYQPLNGVRIVDLSRLLPGPYLTQLLADLGAEVIKVETPHSGDYARTLLPELGLHGLFESVNRNKQSLGLDYRNPRGREIFLELCKTADVVLEAFRPGAVQRWGIGYEDVRAVNENIIYCSLSGYGQSGPYRDRAGHDLNYTAVGGALSLNAPCDGAPTLYGIQMADLSGSMLAAISILAALAGRKGAYLDLALLDGVVSWVTPFAGGAFFSGHKPEGGKMPTNGAMACYNVYETADKNHVALSALEPHFWAEFCQRASRAALIPRQLDPLLSDELTALFRQKTRAAWLDLFAEADACLEPVNSFEEMLSHPQVQARGYVHLEDGKPVRMNSPFVFARQESSPPPSLGEHTRPILESLNIASQEIIELSKQGIIKFPN